MRSRQACCCAQFAASESPPLPHLGVDTPRFNSFVYNLRFRKPSWDILLGVLNQAFPFSLMVYIVRILNVMTRFLLRLRTRRYIHLPNKQPCVWYGPVDCCGLYFKLSLNYGTFQKVLPFTKKTAALRNETRVRARLYY